MFTPSAGSNNSGMNALTEETEESQTYRIVGIRADDSREVLGEGLTKEQATELFIEYLDSNQFAALSVERQ
jgi:hypothetical protein